MASLDWGDSSRADRSHVGAPRGAHIGAKATKPWKSREVWQRKPLLKQFVSQSFQSHLISGAFDASLSSAEGVKCVRKEREKKKGEKKPICSNFIPVSVTYWVEYYWKRLLLEMQTRGPFASHFTPAWSAASGHGGFWALIPTMTFFSPFLKKYESQTTDIQRFLLRCIFARGKKKSVWFNH